MYTAKFETFLSDQISLIHQIILMKSNQLKLK